ncbi:hypothetical protein Calab_1457 [Caldithrix abyssi DSM 13497]|uniref:Uncharacterized protein n=1 Tax=Caldithrix abyssi DSM 13497 TaxID=880073 RepID=H1XPV2_CALAY|nr:hypothetical protein [Caldithrix abyssi]APF20394.1 hypothetical protein Cabys_3648 [Caldithrix abyssi DSM 13497]EHO41078.1 hypothetical protein Calab_1457 [Caldithrix abyssi DSM 13497]
MAEIKKTFGSGGANLTPAGHGTPSLADALRDIADDLAMIKVAVDQLIADHNSSTVPTTATTSTLKTTKG